jgi:signal-transduction protein with cAMP-binding, CBS, and nucleotidyltransferase domain
MQTYLEITFNDLQGVEIFASLPDDVLGMIAELCTLRNYKADEYAAIEGQKTDCLFIVHSGKVAIETKIEIPSYTHILTLDTLTRGRVCAWSAFTPTQVLTASIKCLEDTWLIALKYSDLQKLFTGNPQIEAVIMRNLTGVISSRFRDSQTQLTRLCREVLKESIKYKNK